MTSYSRLRDWVLLLGCNFIWASSFVMIKLAQRQVGPAFTTFFPMALATLLLAPMYTTGAALARLAQNLLAFEM